MLGCGCQYTEYGCCEDQKTEVLIFFYKRYFSIQIVCWHVYERFVDFSYLSSETSFWKYSI